MSAIVVMLWVEVVIASDVGIMLDVEEELVSDALLVWVFEVVVPALLDVVSALVVDISELVVVVASDV